MEKTNDVLAYLEAILRRNTAHYQSDFDYDRQMLRGAANKAKESERTFYWMSRGLKEVSAVELQHLACDQLRRSI